MSITGFQDAIKDQVSHYDDTVNLLRNNEILQRNTALAGIQSEVEKYGEIAKLGLEFPMAIEGIKAASKTARAGFSALSAGKDTINSLLEGGTEGIAARAKAAVSKTTGMNFDDLQSRFDNLRTKATGAVDDARGAATGALGDARSAATSAVGDARSAATSASSGVTKTFGEYTGESKANSIMEMSKMRITALKGLSGTPGEDGIEMQATDDLTNSNSLLAPDTYGRDQPSIEPTTSPDQISTQVPTGDDGESFATPQPDIVKNGSYSERTARPTTTEQSTTTVSEDAAPPRGGDVEMGDLTSSETKSNFSGRPANWQNPETGGTKGAGEIRPAEPPPTATGQAQPRPLSTLSEETKEGDNASRLASQAGDDGPDIAPTLDNLGEDAVTSAGGDIAGGVEEGLGAGLLASGIFAPLGALLEGLGAVTEVASVGAGAYGAVQSMIDTGKEEALRNTPMAPIRTGGLDVGGSVGVPELA